MKLFILVILSLLLFTATYSLGQIRVTTDGKIGMGTNTPVAGVKLEVVGSGKFYWGSNYPLQFNVNSMDPRIMSNNKVVFYNMTNSGYIDLQARTVYEYSDRSAKANIQSLASGGESSLAKIKRLQGVTYQWKDATAGTGKQIGFIAQDVEQVLPEVVATIDSTGGKMLSYTHIIPYLVEAIKEQQVIIENLQQRINAIDKTSPVAVRQEDLPNTEGNEN